MYREIINTARELLAAETNFICNAANLSSFLYDRLDHVNWVGVYMSTNGNLILGPFIGKPACTYIKMNTGVCGKAAGTGKTIIVDDVHTFPGHIACDSASKSEIVVPLIKNGKLYGVLDIDSPVFERFNSNDKENLEEIVQILLESSDMESVYKYYNKS